MAFFVLFDRIWKFWILCTFPQKKKRKFIIGKAILLIFLHISIKNVGKFFWWMVYSLYLKTKSWKSLFWSLFIIFKALSCNLFIQLLTCIGQNNQTKPQYLNSDLIIDLYKRFFSSWSSQFNILENVHNFWHAFVHKVLIWLLKNNFLSILFQK